VRLRLGTAEAITLNAPGGLLILPHTSFSGAAIGGFATASICHFSWPDAPRRGFGGPGYLLPRPGETLHVQAMLRLSLDLAAAPGETGLERRQRLLLAMLDCFDHPTATTAAMPAGDDGLELAWKQAARALHKMRTLSDVAALIGVHESALRARHRRQYRTSAGSHLREMRLRHAEDLLSTTRCTMSEIALLIGYGHAETFSAAFHRSRGCTPGEFRHRSNPFA
jgi:AraC-like DNA-binding protein